MFRNMRDNIKQQFPWLPTLINKIRESESKFCSNFSRNVSLCTKLRESKSGCVSSYTTLMCKHLVISHSFLTCLFLGQQSEYHSLFLNSVHAATKYTGSRLQRVKRMQKKCLVRSVKGTQCIIIYYNIYVIVLTPPALLTNKKVFRNG